MAIIGAGFSGTLLALNLLRHDGPRATLIERGPSVGRGVAYGAAHPDHVLNVRAGNMSAFPDEPDHFVRWLESRGQADAAAAFVPRLTYGSYLAELLEAAVARAGDRLTLVRSDAIDAQAGETVTVALADGRTIAADAAVLAVGNLPPHAPPGLDERRLDAGLYSANPWAPDIGRGLGPDDTLLAVGTGLTMVDVVLMLEAQEFQGRIVALSRRGLVPHRHAPVPPPADRLRERPLVPPSQLVHNVRARGEAIGWRAAVDELRPFTQGVWGNASLAERGRFLRHLRPWWDVHRHRLAPHVADRLAALQAQGRLDVVAGKTLDFTAEDGGVAVTWRPRGEAAPQTMRVRRVVNCTGPSGDLTRTTEPLLAALYARGAIRPDPERLGIDVDPGARVVGGDGRPESSLYALGPMTRGAFWEIVAVPDIRRQAWDLARALSHAAWVGGEGL